MSLLSRYILREAAASTFIVVGVLLVVFMSNQFAEILGDAAAALLPKDAVFRVFGLTFLRYVTLLAPIALLLGIMLALARLNRDSEMAAISACGIGPAKLLRPIGLLTFAVGAFVAWLALVQAPAAGREIEEIRFEARDALELGTVVPGSFTSPDSGRSIVYVREVAGDIWHGVFLYRDAGDGVSVVVADRGERVQDPGSGEVTFRLYDGRRYEGVPGEASWFVAEFEEHGIPIRFEDDEEFVAAVETKPTSLLLSSDDPEDRAELQWRVSAPLSLVVLALLAIPLSRSSPREGRYARVGAALLIYFIYANTLSIARVWVERGQVPVWLGLWWVHALLGAFALLMLLRESGALVRPRPLTPGVRERLEPVA